MNTSFNPELLMQSNELEEAKQRVEKILHSTPPLHPLDAANLPVTRPRKTRSDKGTKKANALVSHHEMVTLNVPLEVARGIALSLVGAYVDPPAAANVQDQIIAHLQKRIAALEK